MGRALRPSDPGELSLNARGCAPREQVVRLGSSLPKWGPLAPTTPMGRALRPSTPGVYLSMRGASPLCTPQVGASGPHDPHGEGAPPLRPRVTFPSRGKSPKARQGLRPLESPEGDASLPLRRGRNPLDRASDTEKDRFATFRLWANRSCFSPLVLSRRYFLLSIRGAGVILPRRNPYYPSRRRWPDR